MALQYLRHALLATTLATITHAQKSSIIPTSLQTAFASDPEVQVSYTNDAVDGFTDGATFSKDAVAKEPTFALGDASGISPSTLYTLILVDFTCANTPVLHYARSNFKNNFDITNIDTASAALQAYKAPGSFGETGDNRRYGFLMYTNPAFKEIDSLVLPGEGEAFDVVKFQSENGLGSASAGVGMVVKLGGTANCGGTGAGSGASASGVSGVVSTTKVLSTSAALRESSTAIEQASTTAVRPVSSTAVLLRSTSVASATPTAAVSQPANTVGASSAAGGSDASGESTSDVAISTALPSSVAASAIITSTIVRSSGGASSTASSGASLQTENAAPGASVRHGWSIAALLLVGGAGLW